MIEAKELRIRNLILSKDNCVRKVLDFKEETYRYKLSNGIVIKHHLKTAKPIPITEEWLIKFRFAPTICIDKPTWSENYHDLTYYDLKLSDNKYVDLSLLSSYVENENITVELFPYGIFKYKYVHEIQNLYFALTGEELTIK